MGFSGDFEEEVELLLLIAIAAEEFLAGIPGGAPLPDPTDFRWAPRSVRRRLSGGFNGLGGVASAARVLKAQREPSQGRHSEESG